ncbi:MAG TPA: hypothetical protein VHL58_08230 [Thermoanaerobaculia bacterium]|nr:hypothetical protein [Thermoanaerobaculia bacterium]
MTTREMLHEIVDKLPESELLTAARILTALEQPANPLQILLANAPPDDEPDDDFDGGLTEARSGQTISHEELLRRLGINE